MDDLVLNVAVDDKPTSKSSSGPKGGRWTERLKAKRSLKRKVRHDEKEKSQPVSAPTKPREERPNKRPRPEARPEIQEEAVVAPAPKQSRPSQIISSLFTYNPKVDVPEERRPTKASAPSNAPLDSSTFTGLNLNPLLIAHLSNKMSIDKPTGIQRAALPVILSPEFASRDVFIQSQTGSGKTLSYLLPIIQDLLPMSSLSYIDRSIGTLAIIIAPTRELAKQISDVLEAILKMRLRPQSDSAGESDNLTRWLVSGLLVGGENRTHEKARLRKGLPILVSTPGRLLDHLQNTSSFNVGKCRWLVLDEADQLMQLGFEETIKGIVQGLDGRRRLAKQAMEAGTITEVGNWDWEKQRRTILCSATLREDVQKLAGTTLISPVVVKGSDGEKRPEGDVLATATEQYTPPSQLSQKYIVAPLKLRLVSLIALLRTLFSQTAQSGNKVIVFLSCTDSVDFHWKLFAKASMGEGGPPSTGAGSESDSDDGDDENENDKKPPTDEVEATCALLPGTTIYRLHGSLPTQTRLRSLKGFSNKSSNVPSVLFCTSVAARGLDLPLVRAVVQYDLPTEGGVNEYIHRVGRTARAGKGGEAWSFVAPSEAAWPKWLEEKIRSKDEKGATLTSIGVEKLLMSGFNAKDGEYEQRATEVQLAFERWVLRDQSNAELARNAYLSHMRAYATHPTSEKHIFHIRNLHLGHLAKAFALREAPKAVKGYKAPSKPAAKERKAKGGKAPAEKRWEADPNKDAEKRMQAIVRSQGRLLKKGGVMQSTGTSEFQLAGGYDLEKLVNR